MKQKLLGYVASLTEEQADWVYGLLTDVCQEGVSEIHIVRNRVTLNLRSSGDPDRVAKRVCESLAKHMDRGRIGVPLTPKGETPESGDIAGSDGTQNAR